jgi:hypothetical protein
MLTFTPAQTEELAGELGLRAPDGAPSLVGVADLLRVASQRWGVTPRRTFQELALGQLDALGLGRPVELVNHALDALIALRELIPVNVPALDYGAAEVASLSAHADPEQDVDGPIQRQLRSSRPLAPCAPAVVLFDEEALLLGLPTPPGLTPTRDPARPRGGPVGRWIGRAEALALLAADDDAAPLVELDAEGWLLNDRVAAEAQRRVDPGDTEAALRAAGEPEAYLWEAMVRDLDRFGGPVQHPEWITVYCRPELPPTLTGHPTRAGAWRAVPDAPDGVWWGALKPERGATRRVIVRCVGGKVVKAH